MQRGEQSSGFYFSVLVFYNLAYDVYFRYAASVIMSVTYGKSTPTTYSDPEVRTINRMISFFVKALLPGRYLVETFPILRYIPGYLSKEKQYGVEEEQFFASQVDIVRKKMVSGQYIYWSSSESCTLDRRRLSTMLRELYH